ncbi:MAG: peptidoglycan DD-metalloendopeptidase family protein [candidate division Zixibacteria bacterium]|nr:peptidoglycan DD-metalloendopeptidase family protein [candidate division Zixibacteria bacterium]
MDDSKYISFLIVPGEGGRTVSFRMHRLTLRVLMIIAAVLIFAGIAGAYFYGTLIKEAATAKQLRHENEMLLAQHAEVLKLRRELEKNREFVNRIAELAGVEYSSAENSFLSDTTAGATGGSVSVAVDSSKVPSGYPLRGFLSKRFSESGLFGEKHLGLDITCPEGTMVRTTADGNVVSAGWDDYFGYTIKIDHPSGYSTVYAHNQELRVHNGDKVKKGQVIALSGNSGKSTGPHLHYEVHKNGKPVDPEDYL